MENLFQSRNHQREMQNTTQRAQKNYQACALTISLDIASTERIASIGTKHKTRVIVEATDLNVVFVMKQ